MKPGTSWLLGLAVIGLAMIGSGCRGVPSYRCWMRGHYSHEAPLPSEPTYRTFASPLYQSNRPQRVVLLESGPTPGNYGESHRLIVELASQIRAAGVFEVVVPYNERLLAQPDNIINGEYDEAEIAEVARRYNADAIALVRVNDLKSFSPMRISATMAIVDSHDSVVMWGVDGTWDTSTQATQCDFRDFANQRRGWESHEEGLSTIYLQSPTLLMSFAASQMTDALGPAVE